MVTIWLLLLIATTLYRAIQSTGSIRLLEIEHLLLAVENSLQGIHRERGADHFPGIIDPIGSAVLIARQCAEVDHLAITVQKSEEESDPNIPYSMHRYLSSLAGCLRREEQFSAQMLLYLARASRGI
jgi:hypothetical protein